MRIIHYIQSSYKDGSFGGGPRFDHELRKAIPDLITVSKSQWGGFPVPSNESDECLIITDHGMVIEVPEEFKCIGVHHGMAATHQSRNPNWDGGVYVQSQKLMVNRNNTWFVGVSNFTANQFNLHHGKCDDEIIVHSVDTKPAKKPLRGKVVLGDWRNQSKGKELIERISEYCSDFKFKQLTCGKFDKQEGYKHANIYLCLSVSEGNSYSMMDALACGLPVLSTDVGLFGGDYDKICGEVIDWKDRDNMEIIHNNLNKIYENYSSYNPIKWMDEKNNFNEWKIKWKNLTTKILNL